MLEEEH